MFMEQDIIQCLVFVASFAVVIRAVHLYEIGKFHRGWKCERCDFYTDKWDPQRIGIKCGAMPMREVTLRWRGGQWEESEWSE